MWCVRLRACACMLAPAREANAASGGTGGPSTHATQLQNMYGAFRMHAGFLALGPPRRRARRCSPAPMPRAMTTTAWWTSTTTACTLA